MENSLCGSGSWEGLQGRDNGLASGTWLQQKGMSVLKWPTGQFPGERYQFNYLIKPNNDFHTFLHEGRNNEMLLEINLGVFFFL